MKVTVKTQLRWEDITYILRDYLLSTSIPFIFRKLFDNRDSFKNESWNALKDGEPKDNECFGPIWEYVLKNTMIMAFRDRLLGSQTDLDNYVNRSEKYAVLFNDIIGGQDCSTDLPGIIKRFYEMTDDYLRRNFAGCTTKYEGLTTKKLLSACREAYHSRSMYSNKEGVSKLDYFYIDFEGQTYSSAMLKQFDEMSEKTLEELKNQPFLILEEMLLTLFMYVYMVEFIIYRPFLKNDYRHDFSRLRNFTFFESVTKTDFEPLYNDEKQRKKDNKDRMSRK